MADDTAPPQTLPPEAAHPDTHDDGGQTAPVSLAAGSRDTSRHPAVDLDEDLPGDTAPLDIDALHALRALVDEETGTTQQPMGAVEALDDEAEEDRSNPDDTLAEAAVSGDD